MENIKNLKDKFNNSKIKVFFSNKKNKIKLRIYLCLGIMVAQLSLTVVIQIGLYNAMKVPKNLYENADNKYPVTELKYLSDAEKDFLLNYRDINKLTIKKYEEIENTINFKFLKENALYYKYSGNEINSHFVDLFKITEYRHYYDEKEQYIIDKENNIIFQQKNVDSQDHDKLKTIMDKIIKNDNFNISDSERVKVLYFKYKDKYIEITSMYNDKDIDVRVAPINTSKAAFKILYEDSKIIFYHSFNPFHLFFKHSDVEYNISKIFDVNKVAEHYSVKKDKNDKTIFYTDSSNEEIIESKSDFNGGQDLSDIFFYTHRTIVTFNVLNIIFLILFFFIFIKLRRELKKEKDKNINDIKEILLKKESDELLNKDLRSKSEIDKV